MPPSDWIAFAALCISFVALGISLAELLSNKPKLRVQLSSASVSSTSPRITLSKTPRRLSEKEIGPDGIQLIAIDVANYGRQPTMVKTVEFQMNYSRNSVCPQPVALTEDTDNTLPAEIKPGQFQTFYFEAEVLVQYNPGTEAMSLLDFVLLKDVEVAIRHSWRRKPQVFRGLQKK